MSRYGDVDERFKKYFKHTDNERYLFDVDEPVKPITGGYLGQPGRVVYRRNGKLGVVFEWDVAGIPVEFNPEDLERA